MSILIPFNLRGMFRLKVFDLLPMCFLELLDLLLMFPFKLLDLFRLFVLVLFDESNFFEEVVPIFDQQSRYSRLHDLVLSFRFGKQSGSFLVFDLLSGLVAFVLIDSSVQLIFLDGQIILGNLYHQP